MKVFLTPTLHAHRRGRFLQGLLDAEPLSVQALPETGLLLMTGEEFQGLEDKSQQQTYLTWSRQASCALVLLPPFQEGKIVDEVDWSIHFASNSLNAMTTDSIAALLAAEMVYGLDARDGGSEQSQGHFWLDHSINTRYWKAHVNTGVFAATTLPIWSISLIDQSSRLKEWLIWLYEQAGKCSAVEKQVSEKDSVEVLLPHDYTIMVCCYGFGVASSSAIIEKLSQSAVPIIQLANFDIEDSLKRLKRLAYLGDDGLTSTGLEKLQSGRYWVFAEHLRKTI